jgi:UDP-N-acetyl-D-mannosaminuronic acid dehydrogenase
LTCLGIAFKPDIDDLRESPALDIAFSLANYKFNKLYIVEPNVANLPGKLKDVSILTDLQTGISEADIIVILVDHKEFKSINNIETTGKYIVDTKGIVDSYE